MEQVCHICSEKEDAGKDTESTVLVLCESCLRSENFYPLLDRIFLN